MTVRKTRARFKLIQRPLAHIIAIFSRIVQKNKNESQNIRGQLSHHNTRMAHPVSLYVENVPLLILTFSVLYPNLTDHYFYFKNGRDHKYRYVDISCYEWESTL